MTTHPSSATPRPSTRRPRAGHLALGLLLGLGACKKDEANAEKAAEATTGSEEPGGARGDEASAVKVAAAPAGLPNLSSAGSASGVYGHVLVPNGGDLLERVQKHLAVPKVAPFVNEGFLRGIAASQLDQRGNLAQNVRLDQPLGCAVLDPKAFEMPAVCVAGYTGGLAQLLKDLGEEGKQADAGGHAAHYQVGGQSLYLDEVGGEVALSGHPDAFGKAKGYLQEQLIGRAGKASGQLELVIYPGAIARAYQSEVEPFLDALEQQSASDPKTGDPDLDRALKVWSESNQKSTRNMFQNLLDLEQVSVSLAVEDAGTSVRVGGIPAKGSNLAQQLAAARAGAIDPAFAGAVPAETAVLVASSQNREGALKVPSSQESMRAMAEAYAAFARRDPKATAEAFADYMERVTKTYGEQGTLALLRLPDTAFGAIMVQQTKVSDDVVRALWDEIAKKATPHALLPKKLQDKVTWSFETLPASAGQPATDRFTLEAIGDAAKALDEAFAKEEVLKRVKPWLGGSWKLVFDRVLVDGRMIVVFAPSAEATYVQAAVAATRGQGSILGGAAVERAASRMPGVNVFFGAHVGRVLDLVREVAPAKEAQQIPQGLGKDVDDMAFYLRTTAEDGFEGELFFSQPLIDQVRNLISQQMQ